MNKSFEDQWKDALGDASQTPPPEIWERVEAELNRKKSRFLIWKNPVRRGPIILSGVAAAVILVLGTLFFINYTTHERGVSRKAGRPAVTQEPEGRSPEQGVASSVSVEEEYERPANRPVTPAPVVSGRSREEQASLTVHALAMSSVKEVSPDNKRNEEQTSLPENALSTDRATSAKENAIAAAYDPLLPLPYREMQAYAPYPPMQVETDYAVSRESKKEKKGWMGVVASNAPFNPNFSTPEFQRQAMMAVQNSNAFLSFDKGAGAALGDYSNSSRNDAQSSFKRGQSMSFGLIFGRRLKKKLSLESGLKFTRATATHTSNVYAVDKATGETESFSYANYVSSSARMSDVLISVNGTSHYSYHFLSVPLLLNYEVLNIGKLNLNAVGGVSSEFLLSGTVVNSKQNEQNFNAGNSNFRPVNIAGVGGLRLSYPVTTLLDINLGGMYQHFLTSGLQKNTDATFRPSMLGVNLGLSVRQ